MESNNEIARTNNNIPHQFSEVMEMIKIKLSPVVREIAPKVEYALSRSLSPTLVAEYELKLPNKALLQRKMQELAELMDEQA